MKRLPWALILSAAGCTAAAFLFGFSRWLPGSTLGVGLAMAALIVAPGFMLITLLGVRTSSSAWGVLSISFGVGLAIFEAVSLIVMSAGRRPAVASGVMAALEFVLLALMIAAHRRGRLMGYAWPADVRARQADLWFALLLMPLIAAYVLEIQYRTPTANADWAQYLTHITWLIRHPGLPYQPHTDALQELNYRLNISGWLSAQAALTDLFPVNTTALDVYWRYMPPVMIVAAAAAVYGLACELFQSASARVASVVGLVVYTFGSLSGAAQGHFEWSGYSILYRMTEDKVVLSFLIVPLMAHLVVAFLRDRRPAQLALILIVSLGGSLMHPLAPPFVLIIAGTYGALTWVIRPSRAAVAGVVLVVLAMLPSFALPLIQSQLQNPNRDRDLVYDLNQFDPDWYAAKESNFQDRLLIFSMDSNNFIVSPEIISYPLTILGCALGLLSGLWLRRSTAARLTFAGTAGPLLLMYTPGLTPLVGRLIPLILIWRMVWLLPIGLSLGWGLTTFAGWLRRRMRGSSPAWPMPAVSCLLLILVGALNLPRDIKRSLRIMHVAEQDRQAERERIELVGFLDRTVSDGRAVLSLPIESYNNLIMSLAADVKVVYYIRAADPDRFNAAIRFYDHAALTPDDVDLLAGTHVGAIVVPHDSPIRSALQSPDFELISSFGAHDVYRLNPDNDLNSVFFDPAYTGGDYRTLADYVNQTGAPRAFVMLDAPGQWPPAVQNKVVQFYASNYGDGFQVTPIANTGTGAALLDLVGARRSLYAIFWGAGMQDPLRAAERTLTSAMYVTDSQAFGRLRLVRFERLDPPSSQPVVSGARFGQAISLRSFSISSASASPGEVIGVTFNWNASEPIPKRYKVFVHLVDSKGNLVSQDDAEPMLGLAPTDSWTREMSVTDRHVIHLPADLPPGVYQIAVGLYTDADGRLAVSGSGRPDSDSLTLADLLVSR